MYSDSAVVSPVMLCDLKESRIKPFVIASILSWTFLCLGFVVYSVVWKFKTLLCDKFPEFKEKTQSKH